MCNYKTAVLFNGVGCISDKYVSQWPENLREKFNNYCISVFSELNISDENTNGNNADEISWIKSAICDRIIYEYYLEKGIRFDIGAGYSSGILNILACFGSLNFTDVYKAMQTAKKCIISMQKNGIFMDMGIIIGLESQTVLEIISSLNAENSVAVGSINSPFCILISGKENAVCSVLEKAHFEGALKTIKMNIGTAFHNPMIKNYCKDFTDLLGTFNFSKPEIPLVSALDQQIMTDSKTVCHDSCINLYTPMRWDLTISALEKMGVTEFYDISTGSALKKISKFSRKSVIHTFPF